MLQNQGMGLKNLSARYLLICNLHITIIDDSEYFTVKNTFTE